MPVVYVASYSIQGFRYFMWSRTRKIQINPRNPAKFPKKHKIPRNPSEILQNTCWQDIFNTYLDYYRPVLFTANVQIYLEKSTSRS